MRTTNSAVRTIVLFLPFFLFLLFLLVPERSFSEEPLEYTPESAETVVPEIDTGDTAWMLTSTLLVLMMTIPGLFLFYGGLVRAKNALGTIMHSFIIVALVSIQWILIGYTLAFGPDVSGIIGNLDWLGLNGVGPAPFEGYASTIPHYVFMAFQMTFAVITVALITGAFAERIKFSTFIVFVLLWTTFIYDPIAHWVWGGGWIGAMGALDFAGGTVVHISSGAAALAAALLFGKRRGYGREPMPPHFLPFSVIGASLLWVGWFGFNAGSSLAADGLASLAFVTTNTATAAAVLGWVFTEWIVRGKPTVLGAATGAVAGLVAITPAAGFVSPMSAILIGFVAGFLCFNAVNLKPRLGYDDSLDVVGVHGIGGTWGALATGLFATTTVNAGGGNGLFFGDSHQFVVQLISVVVTWVFAFAGTAVIIVVLKAVMGLRVSEEQEADGLDLGEHGEVAYTGFQMVHGFGKTEGSAGSYEEE
ncbi:MAG: ammonium transporter [Deltaproteobacteria bacterium]